jgi:hypothetical protein
LWFLTNGPVDFDSFGKQNRRHRSCPEAGNGGKNCQVVMVIFNTFIFLFATCVFLYLLRLIIKFGSFCKLVEFVAFKLLMWVLVAVEVALVNGLIFFYLVI